jgi:hypothetical protein
MRGTGNQACRSGVSAVAVEAFMNNVAKDLKAPIVPPATPSNATGFPSHLQGEH